VSISKTRQNTPPKKKKTCPQNTLTSRGCQNTNHKQERAAHARSGGPEKHLELLAAQLGLAVVVEGDELAEAEDAQGAHVLARLDGREADEGDLHGEESADGVDDRVGHVGPVGELGAADEGEDVHGDEVDEEDVA